MRSRAWVLCCFLSTAIFFTLPPFVFASDNAFNTVFHPLQDLDISIFYNAYHYWIDFFIFLCLFISVGKITLGRRFGGREGKVLSVVIGSVLALSLTLFEYQVGFSIKSFGPFAAGILLFLFGLVIFYLVKSVGAGSGASGSFAFVITYFLVRAALPELFLWAGDNPLFVLLHIVFAVALIISIWKIIGSFWSGRDIRSLGRSLKHSPNPSNIDSGLRRNMDSERQEIHLIKSDLRRSTKKGRKGSIDILDKLGEMIKIIEQYGNTDRAKHLIAEKINAIASNENLILKQLAYLKDLNQRIEDFDFRSFKQLRAKWDEVPEKQREILKEEILLEKNKIISEEKIRQLETVLSKYDNDFRLCLSNSVQRLRSNQPVQAKDWLLKAINCEKGAMNIFKEMKDIEDKLLKLTKREFKTFKKEWRNEKG